MYDKYICIYILYILFIYIYLLELEKECEATKTDSMRQNLPKSYRKSNDCSESQTCYGYKSPQRKRGIIRSGIGSLRGYRHFNGWRNDALGGG